eukprot:16536-Heterococcus_DN1.PRE.3
MSVQVASAGAKRAASRGPPESSKQAPDVAGDLQHHPDVQAKPPSESGSRDSQNGAVTTGNSSFSHFKRGHSPKRALNGACLNLHIVFFGCVHSVIQHSMHASTASAPKGIAPGIPAVPRNSDDVHVIFSTDCSEYQNWQSLLLFWSAARAGQTGPVTRLASGCTPEQTLPLSLRFSADATASNSAATFNT